MPLDSKAKSIRKMGLDGRDEPAERLLLGVGSGILRLSGGIKPADIADADGVLVVPGGVRTGKRQLPAGFNGAVKPDDEMIPDAVESSLLVPAVDVGSTEILAFLGGGAMDHNAGELADGGIVGPECGDYL